MTGGAAPAVPERVTPELLRTLFLFEDLDGGQLDWLAGFARLVSYAPGETIHAEGEPATCFFVLLSGTLVMSRRVHGREIELFRSDHRGSYTGAFGAHVSDQGTGPRLYPSTSRAVTECHFVELPAERFGQAVREWFPMAAHLFDGAGTQGRAANETIERHERLAALGSVTAGLTHELNNPVTAVVRATASLRERLSGLRSDLGLLAGAGLDARQLDLVADLAGQALERRAAGRAQALSPLETSDREDELAAWLEDRQVADGWELAPTLVAAGLDTAWAEELAAAIAPPGFDVALTYTVRLLETDVLLGEISEAAGRISSLLSSAKQYTQMDRAPLQSCDVHEGIEATLTMLGHKLGSGIEVVRDYDRGLPAIPAYPGELNQVWTNLVDNAIDAMEGRGTLTIRTRVSGDEHLVVEIGDTGPGVPEELRRRIFEPFFTTKPVGIGTGIGLDIAWRIVVERHGGDIHLASVPGDTRFAVLLPKNGPGPVNG